VKFTESGSVTMTARAVPGGVAFAVSDTGVGIAPEDQPKVFEEFYQVRGSLQTSAAGSGLGLPFARRVCRILGGDLRLTSVPGEGTTFGFELPLGGPVTTEGNPPA
jgi:signal transduction histidine kinase